MERIEAKDLDPLARLKAEKALLEGRIAKCEQGSPAYDVLMNELCRTEQAIRSFEDEGSDAP